MEVLEGEYFELAASYDPTAFEFRVTWNGHWVGAYHIPSQDKGEEEGLSFAETTVSGAMDIYYLGFTIDGKYRVTIQLVQNLPLTSNQKFRFGLARLGQSRPKRNF